jgi:hypothetical protein
MVRDNHPKQRHLRRMAAKDSRRAPYPRILVVTEGEKSEPLYLKDLKNIYRLHSANLAVQNCEIGTAPLQVVKYAEQLLQEGNKHRGIRPKSFDEVYAVFDRDDHESFFEALHRVQSMNGKLRNDENQIVEFKAIASVPCFELWLLLHFEEVQSQIHRNEVMKRLKHHMPNYQKGQLGIFETLQDNLQSAIKRAQILAAKRSAHDAPFTSMHELVYLLTTLREK